MNAADGTLATESGAVKICTFPAASESARSPAASSASAHAQIDVAREKFGVELDVSGSVYWRTTPEAFPT